MKVLIGCEHSGVVRRAFRALGHEAWSCDLLPSEDDSPFHYQCDVRTILKDGWDIGIFHPDCTYLCSSGMHWTTRGLRDPKLTEDALAFVRELLEAPIDRIALENPIGCISSRIRKPNQIIQPWQYGHDASKGTCLWLKNLPNLVPTNILPKPESGRWGNQTPSGQNKLGPSEKRWKDRARTYDGIAAAMASQWSLPAIANLAPIVESLGAKNIQTITQTVLALDQTPNNS